MKDANLQFRFAVAFLESNPDRPDGHVRHAFYCEHPGLPLSDRTLALARQTARVHAEAKKRATTANFAAERRAGP